MLRSWWPFALLSAVAAAATTIFSKLGLTGVPSNLATALRTAVVLAIAVAIVFATGDYRALPKVGARSAVYLVLSAVFTGISWLAYMRALELGPAARVAAIDKTSLALTVLLAIVVLKEPLTWRLALGAAFIIAGAWLTLR